MDPTDYKIETLLAELQLKAVTGKLNENDETLLWALSRIEELQKDVDELEYEVGELEYQLREWEYNEE